MTGHHYNIILLRILFCS